MEFYTKDLHIRPFCAEDAPAMLELLTDEKVKEGYMLPDYADEQALRAAFDRLLDLSGDDCRYVSAVCLHGCCIGILNDTDIRGDTVELGYAILSRYHNRGYGTQLLGGAIDYMRQQGFSRVLTAAFEENLSSLRVMEKCAMTRMDCVEQLYYRGKLHNCIYYCTK